MEKDNNHSSEETIHNDEIYTKWFAKLLATYQKDLKGKVNKKLYEIVKYRFGFEDCDPHTANDTCRHFGISEEKLYKIETELFQKINESIAK